MKPTVFLYFTHPAFFSKQRLGPLDPGAYKSFLRSQFDAKFVLFCEVSFHLDPKVHFGLR